MAHHPFVVGAKQVIADIPKIEMPKPPVKKRKKKSKKK